MRRQANEAWITRKKIKEGNNTYYRVALQIIHFDLFSTPEEISLIERATDNQAEMYVRSAKKTLKAVGVKYLGEKTL